MSRSTMNVRDTLQSLMSAQGARAMALEAALPSGRARYLTYAVSIGFLSGALEVLVIVTNAWLSDRAGPWIRPRSGWCPCSARRF
jgi:hypothetical protein